MLVSEKEALLCSMLPHLSRKRCHELLKSASYSVDGAIERHFACSEEIENGSAGSSDGGGDEGGESESRSGFGAVGAGAGTCAGSGRSSGRASDSEEDAGAGILF